MNLAGTLKEKALSFLLNFVVYPASGICYRLVRKLSLLHNILNKRSDTINEQGTVDVLWSGLTARILYVLSRSESDQTRVCFVRIDVGIHIRSGDFVDFENRHLGFVDEDILLG